MLSKFMVTVEGLVVKINELRPHPLTSKDAVPHGPGRDVLNYSLRNNL